MYNVVSSSGAGKMNFVKPSWAQLFGVHDWKEKRSCPTFSYKEPSVRAAARGQRNCGGRRRWQRRQVRQRQEAEAPAVPQVSAEGQLWTEDVPPACPGERVLGHRGIQVSRHGRPSHGRRHEEEAGQDQETIRHEGATEGRAVEAECECSWSNYQNLRRHCWSKKNPVDFGHRRLGQAIHSVRHDANIGLTTEWWLQRH